MRLKFRLSWIISLILAVLLLTFLSWWTGALYLSHLENQWIDGKRNDGWKIEFSERTKTGYPLRWRSTYSEITIKPPFDKKKIITLVQQLCLFRLVPPKPKRSLGSSRRKNLNKGV